jgi:heavy metal translocating P-type ATPase
MLEAEGPVRISTQVACDHCDGPVLATIRNQEKNIFCCHGCKTVFQILKENNLCEYYKVRDQSGEASFPIEDIDNQKFAYLDDPQFIEEHTQKREGNKLYLRFYLEGIHCLACLWLIEKIPQLVKGVVDARLNMGKSQFDVLIDQKKGGLFSQVARKLSQLGYHPHPILKGDEAQQFQEKEERKLLLKMGVAAAAAMNIMLYSVSIYAGASGIYAKYFSWISFFLCLPVVFYSSIPFFISAKSAIFNKHINIDIPLSLAIIVGFFASTFFTLRGSSINYYDSIATLVFLILFSRYLLKKSQQKSLQSTKLSTFLNRGPIRRWNEKNQQFDIIHPSYLKKGNIIKVYPGEVIPADGIVTEGSSQVNLAALTGEANPVPTGLDSAVFSGTENVGQPLTIKVKSINEETRLGKILQDIDFLQKSKAPITTLTDKISRYFVWVVISLALLTFLITLINQNFLTALNRFLALIIVTCPCALGLGTPLAFSRSMNKAAKLGMIIKSEETLEKMTHIKNLFLDKTGTLTFGKFKVLSWRNIFQNSSSWSNEQIVLSLESRSRHPLAKSLVEYLHEQKENALGLEWDKVEEILGKGMTGEHNNSVYQISGLQGRNDQSTLGLFENGNLLSEIILMDQIRPEAKNIIQFFKRKGKEISLLSGDSEKNVQQTASLLDITNFSAALSPESKATYIRKSQDSLMVGDGANDAMALGLANVSVAVKGSVESSLRVADIYLSKKGLQPLKDLFDLSNGTLSVVKRNLVFSLLYNIIGGTLAIMGHITPLWAAVLMPLSSLTVTFSTLVGNKKLRGMKT